MMHSQKVKNSLYGIGLMLVHSCSVAVLYGVIKVLSGYMNSSQVAFFYKCSLLICILPWVLYSGLASLKTTRFKLYLCRGFLSTSASLCIARALQHLNIADVTALGYLEQVLLVIVGVVYFKESAAPSRLIAICLSFLGAILTVYPDSIVYDANSWWKFKINPIRYQFNQYYILVFASVVLWATSCLIIKFLGKTESTKTQTFYATFLSTVISFPAAFIVWQPVSFGDFHLPQPAGWVNFQWHTLIGTPMILILVLALFYFLHTTAFFNALKKASISTVMPFDYSRMIFAGAISYYFFGQPVRGASYLGYFLIAASGIYLARQEMQQRNRPVAAAMSVEAEPIGE